MSGLYEHKTQIAEAIVYCEAADAHEGTLGEPAARSILLIALKALWTAQVEQAERIARGKMLLRHRTSLVLILDNIEDEGDRVYFGSTNDADELKEIVGQIQDFHWHTIRMERDAPDLLASSRAAHDKVRELELGNLALLSILTDLDAVCPENWADDDEEARAWAAAKKALDAAKARSGQ